MEETAAERNQNDIIDKMKIDRSKVFTKATRFGKEKTYLGKTVHWNEMICVEKVPAGPKTAVFLGQSTTNQKLQISALIII